MHGISGAATCGIEIAAVLLEEPCVRALHLAQPLCADRGDASYIAVAYASRCVRAQRRSILSLHAVAAPTRRTPAMGLVHERLLNATYWKEIVGDAPEEGVDPLVLKLFAGVMLLWVLFGPCLTYAVELSGRRRKRLKQD